MRTGSKWIAGPAAGLVLLVGGVWVAGAMGNQGRSARVSTPSAILTYDPAGDRGNGADDSAADRGSLSGRDGAADHSDDRGSLSGRDSDHHGATAGRDSDHIAGAAAQRARAAALAAAPGASVREVERTSDRGAAYHVELVRPDGTRVEVDLNANFELVRIERSGHDGGHDS